MEVTEVTTATHMATATTARDPLMLSPPCSLEPAVLCPPPLLSSTTPQSSLTSPTLPIPWPMLATPPTPWLTMVSPSWLPLSLLLRRPWLLRGRRERPTLRSSSTVLSSLLSLLLCLTLVLLLGLLLMFQWSRMLRCLPPRSATRLLPTPSLLLLITASLTGVDFVLFLCLVPAIRALLLFY